MSKKIKIILFAIALVISMGVMSAIISLMLQDIFGGMLSAGIMTLYPMVGITGIVIGTLLLLKKASQEE